MNKNNNNRANQLNPNNDAYWQSRGYIERPKNWPILKESEKQKKYKPNKKDLDNRSNQLNPQHPAYTSSRILSNKSQNK